jgi:MFS family permease
VSDKPRVAHPRAFWSLVIANGLDNISWAIAVILMGFLVEDLTHSATWVAAFSAAFGIGYVIGQFPSNLVVNALRPHRTIMLVGLGLAVLQALIAAAVVADRVTAWMLVANAGLVGLLLSFASPVAWSILLKSVSGKDAAVRGAALYYGVTAGLGIAGSIAGTVLLESQRFALGLAVAAAVQLVIVLIGLTLRSVPVDRSEGTFRPVTGFREASAIPGARWLILFTVAVGLLAASLLNILPVLSDWVDSDLPSYLGLLFIAFYVGSALQALAIVRLERFGTRILVLVGGITLGSLLLVLALTRHPGLTLVIIVGYGLALGIVTTMFSSTISAISTPKTHGPFMSLYTLVFTLAGTFVGALLWGVLTDSVGLQPVLIGAGLAMLVASLVSFQRFPRQRPSTQTEPNNVVGDIPMRG